MTGSGSVHRMGIDRVAQYKGDGQRAEPMDDISPVRTLITDVDTSITLVYRISVPLGDSGCSLAAFSAFTSGPGRSLRDSHLLSSLPATFIPMRSLSLSHVSIVSHASI